MCPSEVVRVLEDKAFLPGDYVVRVGEAGSGDGPAMLMRYLLPEFSLQICISIDNLYDLHGFTATVLNMRYPLCSVSQGQTPDVQALKNQQFREQFILSSAAAPEKDTTLYRSCS